MVFFPHLFSIISATAKRIRKNIGISICLTLGISVSVAIVVGIPVYSNAINSRMLWQELSAEGGPPLSFLFWYLRTATEPVGWEDFAPLDEYYRREAAGVIGLPEKHFVRYICTDRFRLYPTEENLLYPPNQPLYMASIGFLTGIGEHAEILEGYFPRGIDADESFRDKEGSAALEVLMTLAQAEKTGIRAGEEFIWVIEEEDSRTGIIMQTRIPIRIAGIWAQRDPAHPYWFYASSAFDSVLVVPDKDSLIRYRWLLANRVNQAIWYLVYDDADLSVDDVPQLLNNTQILRTKSSSLGPNVSLASSPVEEMRKYRAAASQLTVLLFIFGIPVFGLILYFITLISAMIVERQSNEIALLRSRGSSRLQIVAMFLFESILLGSIGTVIGVLLGYQVASAMGSAQSFLVFDFHDTVSVTISWRSVLFGVAAAGLSISAIIWPVLSASRHTIVSYKQEQARLLRTSLWKRYYLDFALLIPLGYGYYSLSQKGAAAFLAGRASPGDAFSNPVLFLVPTLFVLAFGLLFLRIFPLLMGMASKLVKRFKGAPLVLSTRSLAGSSGHYKGPLLLLVITAGFSAFTASMARTLDGNMVDSAYYRSGGDFQVQETGELLSPKSIAIGNGMEPEQSSYLLEKEHETPYRRFISAFEYQNLPGIIRATRVGDYMARIGWSDFASEGRILGVDPEEFWQISYFRPDFSPFSLESLMKILSLEESSVLVTRRFFTQHHLRFGDRIKLSVSLGGNWRDITFKVGGLVDYLPTAFPEDGPFFVSNLSYLFSQAGGEFRHNIWLKTEDSATGTTVAEGLREFKLSASITKDPQRLIEEQKQRPERQGFYGLLSIGFAISAVVTALGFLLYAFISFQRRSIELGVLRSVGLSMKQTIGFVVIEQLSLVMMGMAVGAFLGVAASHLFIPFLQIGMGEHAQTPPFIVRIGWVDIAWILLLLGAVLASAIGVLVWQMARLKIFQAVKLEEIT